MERKHYSRAPIREAVIDVRVTLPAAVDLRTLDRIDLSNAGYPVRQNRMMLKSVVQAGSEVSTTTSQSQTGYVFVSADERQLLQARLDGYTFSRLEPYERWESFRDEARRLWEHYCTATQPVSITRVAVRYINRLDLPEGPLEISAYLRTAPDVSADLPEPGLSGYLMRLEFPQESLGAMTIVTEALVSPANEGVTSVILDIDVFKSSAEPNEDGSVWQVLEALHDRETSIFEACITDRTRGLIA